MSNSACPATGPVTTALSPSGRWRGEPFQGRPLLRVKHIGSNVAGILKLWCNVRNEKFSTVSTARVRFCGVKWSRRVGCLTGFPSQPFLEPGPGPGQRRRAGPPARRWLAPMSRSTGFRNQQRSGVREGAGVILGRMAR